MKKKPWEKTLRWRVVFNLGLYSRFFKIMWLNKVRDDGFDCLKNDKQS